MIKILLATAFPSTAHYHHPNISQSLNNRVVLQGTYLHGSCNSTNRYWLIPLFMQSSYHLQDALVALFHGIQARFQGSKQLMRQVPLFSVLQQEKPRLAQRREVDFPRSLSKVFQPRLPFPVTLMWTSHLPWGNFSFSFPILFNS